MGRYKHLKENLYYDTKDKVIVKNMGNRYVYVRHDRRTHSSSTKTERRADEKTKAIMMPIERGLCFDKKTYQIYKKSGDKFVLYSKDRRKSRKIVAKDRRKK